MKTVIKYRFFFSPRMTPLLKFYVAKRECRTLLHSVRGKVNTVKCFRLHSDQIRRCSEGRSCRRIIVCSGNSSGFWLSSSNTKIFSSLSSPLLQSDTKKNKNICPNCLWQKRNVGNKINSIWLFPKPLLHQNYSVNAGFLKVGSQNPRRVCVSHSPSWTRWNNRKL